MKNFIKRLKSMGRDSGDFLVPEKYLLVEVFDRTALGDKINEDFQTYMYHRTKVFNVLAGKVFIDSENGHEWWTLQLGMSNEAAQAYISIKNENQTSIPTTTTTPTTITVPWASATAGYRNISIFNRSVRTKAIKRCL